jgi:group I intron endonuclease
LARSDRIEVFNKTEGLKSHYWNCVYFIRNIVNGKIYVGATKKGHHRLEQHLSSLKSGTHINEEMQADFDKYGEKAFETLMFNVDDYEPHEAERLFIYFLDAVNPHFGYNRDTKHLVGYFSYEKYAEIRDESGYTDLHVAKNAGISYPTISSWKNGSKPKLHTLEKLAKFFNVPEDQFLDNRFAIEDEINVQNE